MKWEVHGEYITAELFVQLTLLGKAETLKGF